MKKFLVVDDHSIVRAGIKIILRDNFVQCSIEEAHDGNSAIEKIKYSNYDLVILDIHMPNTDTTSLISNILALKPVQKILIFTMGSEEIFAKRYLKMGVMGFISKDCADSEVSDAIQQILQNKKYISQCMIMRMTDDSINKKSDNPFDDLSKREFEIALHLINGRSLSEITEIFSITNSTVGTHKARILEKLKVSNLIELRELARLFKVIS